MTYKIETRTVYVTEMGDEFTDETLAKRQSVRDRLTMKGYRDDDIDMGLRLFRDQALFQELLATYDEPQAPKVDDDGWIEWKGGECPVPREKLVEVRFRNLVTNMGCTAGFWGWDHSNGGWDIVTYRVISD